MISILEVINFQSWKNVVIEFHKGVNIIKGTSDTGKSSLMRVFDWIFRNQPINDEMRPWSDVDKKLTISGSVEFDDSQYISRIKDGKFNGYETSIGPFEALHRSLPEEIVALANMNENVHMQDDGYFLLTESPGNVARILNRKSGLEDIDIIAKAAKSVLSEITAEKKTTESKLKESLALISDYEKIEDLKDKFTDINRMFSDYETKIKRLHDLKVLIKNIELFQKDIKYYEKTVSYEKNTTEIKSLISDEKDIKKWINDISWIIKKIEITRMLIDDFKIRISDEKRINELKNLISENKKTDADLYSLLNLIENIENTHVVVERERNKIIRLKKKKKTLEIKLTYCPHCGADKKYWRKK